MLKAEEKHSSLAGKLLLSSALVAVTLAYGWWQRPNTQSPRVAMAAPAPLAQAPVIQPAAPAPQATAPAPPPVTASAAPAAPVAPPETKAAALPRSTEKPTAAPKVAAVVPPPAITPAPPQTSPPQETAPSSPPLTFAASPPLPTVPSNDVSPPIPLATGTPVPGAAPSIPAGTHLQDGDYVSDRHQLEWGDLRVKISVHGGLITGVQILQYPDHRSRSLDLSEMAGPTLESEVIKTQHAQVDAVSSATDTSYAFQDTMADVILKATRE